MSTQVKTKFYLRNPNGETETPIVVSIHFNGNRYRCKTNLTVNPAKWNKETNSPHLSPQNKTLLTQIGKIEDAADTAYKYFLYSVYNNVAKKVNPTNEDFTNKFYQLLELNDGPQKTTDAEKKLSLFDFIDKFISEAEHRQNEHTGKKIAHNTIKVYKQCKRLLKEFSSKKYKLDFERLQLDTLLDFKDFLNKKGYSQNTVAKHIITLKTFINEAFERGYTDSLAHKSKRFRAVQVQTDEIYLTDEELDELFKLDLSKTPHLDRVRDLFLVGCYTGLRFSDFTNIQPENIDGAYIEIKSEKTNIDTVIPIHPVVNAIMQKYEGKYINCLPPAISNQKFNEYIKEVCTKCKLLNKVIKIKNTPKGNDKTGMSLIKSVPKYTQVSSHTARRSFATNQYNKGISANILMKITGHKTERSFYTYIRVTPKENAQRLRELWQKESSHLKVV